MYIIKFLGAWYRNRKITRILKKTYKDEDIIAKLSYTFGVQFDQDWVGRVYAVVNPVIRDGQFNSEQAIEYTNQGRDNSEYVQHWVMERLILMDSFLKSNDLFDILTYEIRKIDSYGNNLLILSPITFNDFKQKAKNAAWELTLLGLTAGLIFACWGKLMRFFV